jgi:hypothetical protein
MEWKLIFKTSAFVGIMLIIANLVGLSYSIYQFYGVETISHLLLFISMYVVAIVSTFSFIYRRAGKFRLMQAILTTVFSILFGYVFSIVSISVYLKLSS